MRVAGDCVRRQRSGKIVTISSLEATRCAIVIQQTIAARNAALDAEVRDLKEGLGAIEERARNELGMIRRDEVFFQVLERSATEAPGAPVR